LLNPTNGCIRHRQLPTNGSTPNTLMMILRTMMQLMPNPAVQGTLRSEAAQRP